MNQTERDRDTCRQCQEFHPNVKTHRYSGTKSNDAPYRYQKSANNRRNKMNRAEYQRANAKEKR